VLTESASRYFFRNAINNGLPILICEGIAKKIKTDDELELNISRGEVYNVTTGLRLQTNPLPENLVEILRRGGYIPYIKEKYGFFGSLSYSVIKAVTLIGRQKVSISMTNDE